MGHTTGSHAPFVVTDESRSSKLGLTRVRSIMCLYLHDQERASTRSQPTQERNSSVAIIGRWAGGSCGTGNGSDTLEEAESLVGRARAPLSGVAWRSLDTSGGGAGQRGPVRPLWLEHRGMGELGERPNCSVTVGFVVTAADAFRDGWNALDRWEMGFCNTLESYLIYHIVHMNRSWNGSASMFVSQWPCLPLCKPGHLFRGFNGRFHQSYQYRGFGFLGPLGFGTSGFDVDAVPSAWFKLAIDGPLKAFDRPGKLGGFRARLSKRQNRIHFGNGEMNRKWNEKEDMVVVLFIQHCSIARGAYTGNVIDVQLCVVTVHYCWWCDLVLITMYTMTRSESNSMDLIFTFSTLGSFQTRIYDR